MFSLFVSLDTVYFVLPGQKKNLHTVYGVSCYRQMAAEVSMEGFSLLSAQVKVRIDVIAKKTVAPC